MYMTLGNLELDPRCGLLFIDWTRGGALHLTGRAHVVEVTGGCSESRARAYEPLRREVQECLRPQPRSSNSDKLASEFLYLLGSQAIRRQHDSHPLNKSASDSTGTVPTTHEYSYGPS
ncbi:pyridoxamine 5'-phosphate oxidase family protein [Rhodococcus sp. IEGM 1366]|uniref:pyridoxamine 5'-phosphate oxidase family protein n=1 Tax=Rhodococcus sp. IEGM 1366 TaxID=3082223 RepID=UPI00398A26FB